ncbi:MAG: glycosyltransferase family 2 protein [Candidatus Margulisiibacteriota bacterium]
MLSVIIPNFNGKHLLDQFLPNNLAILDTLGHPYEVILVDDASTDGGYTTDHPKVRQIQNPVNSGFSITANAGAAAAQYPILLFLNSDIKIETLDFDPILAYLSQPDVFSVTPKIINQRYGKIESITVTQFAGGFLHGDVMDAKPEDLIEGRSIAWGCGGGVFIKKSVFDAFKGFNPIYSPFYFEDLDLGYRGWQQNLKSLYTNAATFLHCHQGTIGSHYTKAEVDAIYERNKLLFHWQNLRGLRRWSHHLISLALFILTGNIQQIRAIKAALKTFYAESNPNLPQAILDKHPKGL